jgi:flagellar protein FlgJ
MTAPVTDVSVYSDLNGLNKLKQGAQAQDPKAIREAARQFESVFARMMLKSMRDANFKDPNFGSDQEEFYQGMFDDQLSVELTKGHGLGLADMLVQQLTKAGLVPPGAANAVGQKKELGNAGAAAAPGATNLAATDTAATNQGPTSATADITTAASGTTTSFDTANAIDSFDPTNAAAAGATGSDPSSLTTQAAFVRALWPFAQAAGQALGTDPRNIVAQAALETGWGRAVPADGSGRSSNNLFGIKAGSQWVGPSVGARTLEFSDGVPSARVDKFRAYGSATDSFQDYVKLLSGNPRYSGALNTGSDTSAFASALQRGGYSTDPAYAHKLTAIAQNVTGMTVGLKSAAAEPIHLTTTIL